MCQRNTTTVLISMRMNVACPRKLQRNRLALYTVALSSLLVHLASCLALMSQTSSNNAGKHWSDDEVDHMLDRLAEWRTVGKVGDGGNFTTPAFTAASRYLATKSYTRTMKQCKSKYNAVSGLVISSVIACTHQLPLS